MTDYGDISEQQAPDAIARQVEEVDVREFVAAYLECAVWASTEGEQGTPIDSLGYSVDDLTLEAQANAEDDCRDFLSTDVRVLIRRAIEDPPKGATPYSYGHAGHDFFLTRNSHGAGFWDRGLGDVGDELTALSRPYGTADVYVDDDETLGYES